MIDNNVRLCDSLPFAALASLCDFAKRQRRSGTGVGPEAPGGLKGLYERDPPAKCFRDIELDCARSTRQSRAYLLNELLVHSTSSMQNHFAGKRRLTYRTHN
jgi:hypothetical protein